MNKFKQFLQLEESLDNVYDWKEDEINLPFYVYKQYVFDVGSTTFAVRFNRTKYYLGVTGRHISYVVVGKKINKKVSTKIVGIGNVRKFIATIYAIIQYHLEENSKVANRGVVIRFDEKFFDRMSNILSLILRMKLKNKYLSSEEFTWSPFPETKMFYVWKKQFNFKTLFKEFIDASQKQEGPPSTTVYQDDLAVDPSDDMDAVYGNEDASANDYSTSPSKDIPTVDNSSSSGELNEPSLKINPKYTEKELNDVSVLPKENKCHSFDDGMTLVRYKDFGDQHCLYVARFSNNGLENIETTKGFKEEVVSKYLDIKNASTSGLSSIGVYDGESILIGGKVYKSGEYAYSAQETMFTCVSDTFYSMVRISNDTISQYSFSGQIIKTLYHEMISTNTDSFVFFPLPRRIAAGKGNKNNIVFVKEKTTGILTPYRLMKGVTLEKVEEKFGHKNVLGNISLSDDAYTKKVFALLLRNVKDLKASDLKKQVDAGSKPKKLSELSKKRYDFTEKDYTFFEKPVEKSFDIGPFTINITDDLALTAQKLQQIKELIKNEEAATGLKAEINQWLNERNIAVGNYLELARNVNQGILSEETKTAISNYTGTSYNYINQYLRGFKNKEELGQVALNVLNQLDQAFVDDAVYINNKDMVVYRGQSMTQEEIDLMISTGKYTTNSFYSTSFNMRTALAFLKFSGAKEAIADQEVVGSSMSIYEPSKSRIANMIVIHKIHRIPVIIPGSMSKEYYRECEIILPRSTDLKLNNWQMNESKNGQKLFICDTDVVGVAGEKSLVENVRMRLTEMIEADEKGLEIANEILITDTFLDILQEGAVFPGTDNDELIERVVKWTTD